MTDNNNEKEKKIAAAATASCENGAPVVSTTITTAAAAADEATSRQDATETNGNKRPVEDEITTSENVNGSQERNTKKQRVDQSSSASSSAPAPAPQQNGESNSDTTTNNDLTEVAKSRLSKWAARFFDPNRPRSLIETPKEIPLNDEFLKAFGQREKEHDKAMGRDQLDIDHNIPDDDDDVDDDNKDNDEDSLYAGVDEATAEALAATKKKASSGSKIKISNIKFTTTEATLMTACQRYGPVASVKLIMNKSSNGAENAGRAFVTFEEATSAMACLENLKTMDGRSLRSEVAADKAPPNRTSSGGGGGGGGPARYWERNIRTKCFKCGGVGHMEADCENKAMAQPCPLCAQTNHTIRTCPVKSVCYNCGIPGHVSRDCMQQRNLPPRRICTICYQTDHTKEVCRNGFTSAQSYNAECMVCYERGHHLCKEMKWARGHQLQQGVSCYNCGQANHVGSVCGQPKFDDCSRDEALAIHLVDQATKFYEDERNRARGGGGGGGRASLGGGDGDRNYPPAARGRQAQQDFEFDRRRNRSMPPMRNAPSQQQQQKQPPGGGDHRRHRGR